MEACYRCGYVNSPLLSSGQPFNCIRCGAPLGRQGWLSKNERPQPRPQREDTKDAERDDKMDGITLMQVQEQGKTLWPTDLQVKTLLSLGVSREDIEGLSRTEAGELIRKKLEEKGARYTEMLWCPFCSELHPVQHSKSVRDFKEWKAKQK